MPLKKALLLLLIVLVVSPLLAWLVVRWRMVSSPPPPPGSQMADLGRYRDALNLSNDPAARAIRRRIASGPRDLARERAAAHQEGIDLNPAHLQRPLPSVAQNAAPLYTAWTALRHRNPLILPNYAETLNARFAYTPAQLATVQRLLAEHQDAMTLLHRAADRPQCVFVEDWKDLPTKGVPGAAHFASFREIARELNTESYLLARKGRYADAVTDQARGFRVAGHIGSEPTAMCFLVGGAIETITLSGMESILDLSGPNAVVAAQVQQEIQTRRPDLSLKHALLGEAAISTVILEGLRHATPTQLAAALQDQNAGTQESPPFLPNNYTPDERRFLNNLIDATEAADLDQLRRLIAVADKPSAVRRPVFASVASEVAKAPLDPVQRLNPVRTLFTLLTPGFGTLDVNESVRRAREGVLQAGASVLEAKARSGHLPAALPVVAIDPFSGKRLGYRREGISGFVVYSVGPSGLYDGGRPGETPNPQHIVFRYPGPMPKPVPPSLLRSP